MKQIGTETSRDFQGIWIPSALWKDRSLSMTQKVILLEVRSFQKNGLPCFVSNDHLADLCGVSCSAIEKALKLLVQMDRLKRWTEYDGKKRNRLMHVLDAQLWEHPQPVEVPTRNQLRYPPAASCGDHPQPAAVPTRNQLRNTIPIEQTKEQTKRKKGTPTDIDEVREYFTQLLVADPASMAEDFWNYYESNGWHVGKNKMRSWTAAASQWNKRQNDYTKQRNANARGYAGANSGKLAEAIRNQTS